MQRIIAHLDMDAFFAAVEERDRPRLKGLPIAIGADPKDGAGRGIVATANYAARAYGIHSTMPISRAWRASEEAKKRWEPEVVFIQGNHEKYGAVSESIMKIIKAQLSDIASPKDLRCPYVARASIDEAYFDLSFAGSFEKAKSIAKKIKAEIKSREKLTASVGIGPNKLIAKIASDMQKPDGLTIITPEETETFLDPLPIRKIPGIGPKTEIQLNKIGVKTVKDLKKYSQKELADMLGEWGLSLYKKIRGIDNSPVYEEHEVKSIGEQETFMQDTLDSNIILNSLATMCKNIMKSLMKNEFPVRGRSASGGKTIVITVRFEDFKTATRSKTFHGLISSAKELETKATQMILPFFDKRENPKKKLIRLVGVRIEKLS